jgi:hypothetical protein
MRKIEVKCAMAEAHIYLPVAAALIRDFGIHNILPSFISSQVSPIVSPP